MAVAYTFVDLMKQAGQNPTRQSVIDTLNSGKGQPGPGIVPLGYSSGSHLGFTGEQVFTIKSGAAIPEGPVYTSTDTGPIKTFNGGETTPPTNGIP